MNITEKMIEDWLCEQEDDLVIEIYNEVGYGNEVCRMRRFDEVMGQNGYDRFDSVQMALSSDRFDTEDDYFKLDWPYVESSNEAIDLIDYEQLAQKIYERGTDNEIYKEWVASLEKPEHTEDEYIKALTEQLKNESDIALAFFKNHLWGDDYPALHRMCDFVFYAKLDSLFDIIRRLVMTSATQPQFFDCDFFWIGDSSYTGISKQLLIDMVARKLYEIRETATDSDTEPLGEELIKIMKGEF